MIPIVISPLIHHISPLRTTYQLIISKGYPAEQHRVLTNDGYELTMHRIPQPVGQKAKGVVYLQHGLLDASHTWVINFPHQSLGVCLFFFF